MTSFDEITPALERLAIEVPSWAYGNSGTRFKVFAQPGVPRDPFEKIADAAEVHRATGVAPSVALHIPWDRVDDPDKLRAHAEDLGVSVGTINSNTFQDDDYMLGSFCHVDDRIRAKAVRHAIDCIDIMDITGSRDLKVWLPDGLNYPGQGDLRGRQDRLADSLAQVYGRLGDRQRLVLEYKFFEPAFYATDVPDWGTSYVQCVALGDRAVVCLDTGHHAPGTNIEFIVMQLLRLGRLGAFDFNSRFYADDDLIVGAADPFQLFRIMFEVIRGGGLDADVVDGPSPVSFMLDQCHNVEAKIPAQIRSVLNVVEMTAKALLVDRVALADAERAGDVLAGNAVMMDAFATDVRSDLADWRATRHLPTDPMGAYLASGYQERIVAERVGGDQAGWGA
ncbi:L-rhamnose isomerase [Dermatobacter hominis]|uniref:L-rhamnose isomerase n=1 Tax=Dermatobacter hominis TaxID=2884263 RepID=UPI001D12459F|nr:L-rhamnose isomerase [Dermatobacter hominis]UDY34913.1 L-rhamnose isomerase [Dermatobacter hominis]